MIDKTEYVIKEVLYGISGSVWKEVWRTPCKRVARLSFQQMCEQHPDSILVLNEERWIEKQLACTATDENHKRDYPRGIIGEKTEDQE